MLKKYREEEKNEEKERKTETLKHWLFYILFPNESMENVFHKSNLFWKHEIGKCLLSGMLDLFLMFVLKVIFTLSICLYSSIVIDFVPMTLRF